MQRAPSASDDTVYKQLVIPKRTASVNKVNQSEIRTTPSVRNENNMHTAPSARDNSIHKQLLIPKRTTSVNKVNQSKIRTTPSVRNENNMHTAPSARDNSIHKQLLIPKRTTSVNKLTRVNYGRHHLLEMNIICTRHHLQGTTPSTNNY